MTIKEKNKILNLKKNGLGYKAISKALDIPLSSVKAFLRRRVNYEEINEVCRYCKKELIMVPGKKKKQFCNDVCRMSFWRENRHLMDLKAIYTFTCSCCNKRFVVYGNKDRKYCSRSCYLKARYGNE